MGRLHKKIRNAATILIPAVTLIAPARAAIQTPANASPYALMAKANRMKMATVHAKTEVTQMLTGIALVLTEAIRMRMATAIAFRARMVLALQKMVLVQTPAGKERTTVMEIAARRESPSAEILTAFTVALKPAGLAVIF